MNEYEFYLSLMIAGCATLALIVAIIVWFNTPNE